MNEFKPVFKSFLTLKDTGETSPSGYKVWEPLEYVSINVAQIESFLCLGSENTIKDHYETQRTVCLVATNRKVYEVLCNREDLAKVLHIV